MFATAINLALFLASGGSAEGAGFYDKYLNFPGFEAWKFFNLAIFIFVIAYILRKPMGEVFKAKREKIRAELIRAEEEKKAALAELTAAEAKLVSLEAEKNAVIERAKAEADAEKARLAEQTAAEIKKLREQAGSEIARIAQQAKAELRKFSAEESIRLAEEKLRSRIDPQSDARLVKANIDAIGGMN